MASVYDTATSGVVKGFTTDSTTGLQNAINAAATAGKVLFISGQYGINATSGLTIPSNSHIKFLPGSCLKLLGYSTNSYAMLDINGASNVTIDNAVLDGSKESNTLAPSGNDYGMGIVVEGGSTNVTINAPVINDCWGDGIYVDNGTNACVVDIRSPRIHRVRRNGISVISANGLTLTNPEFYGIQDTNPKLGIDFEPNSNADVLQNIMVVSPRTYHCQEGLGFTLSNLPGANAQNVSITIIDYQDVYSTDTAISFYNLAKGTYSIGGSINIVNPKFMHSNITTYYSNWDNSIAVTISGATTVA